jgi:hypothetical protein
LAILIGLLRPDKLTGEKVGLVPRLGVLFVIILDVVYGVIITLKSEVGWKCIFFLVKQRGLKIALV